MKESELLPKYDIESVLTRIAWCKQQFGPSKVDSSRRWIGGRWFVTDQWTIKFSHEQDAVLYTLRWL